MSAPLVTVIVAAYNGERFLREALASVYEQDFDSYECVLIDDGSTDATAEIARDFPLRYHRQDNHGLSAARNTGLGMARGDLIAFLDDDDVLPPTKISVQAGCLSEHPEIDCVLGRQEWIVEAGIDPPEFKRDPIFGDPGGIALGTAMIRSTILKVLGGFDPSYRYAEDRDLFVRLRERGAGIVVLSDVVLRRRLHGANMTLSPPRHHPLLRSLREKVERGRQADGESV